MTNSAIAIAPEWRAIPSAPDYEASDRGSVRLRADERVLAGWKAHGYHYVSIRIDGEHRSKRVHRLVLEAFVGPCPDGMEACHNNGKRADNRWPENLRWDTPKANAADRERHGTQIRGEGRAEAKLSNRLIVAAHRLYARGLGSKAIAKQIGVSRTTIKDALSGKRWQHVPIPRGGPPRKSRLVKLTASDTAAVAAHRGWLHPAHLAEVFGIDKSRVYQIWRDHVRTSTTPPDAGEPTPS